MEKAVICFIILGIVSGFTEAAGVLPDVLNVTAGDTVTFPTTLTRPERLLSVIWTFDDKTIATSNTTHSFTEPEYGDRLTFSTYYGYLTLRAANFNDSGEYKVSIIQPGGQVLSGSSRLEVYGFTRAGVVLPDGPLNASVGTTVTFNTTLTPPEQPFLAINWTFGAKNIIISNTENITEPEYEDRITLFISTGSLELRDVTFNDSGEYRVSITQSGGELISGNTTLEIYEPVSSVVATASSTDLVEFNSSVRLSCSSSGSSLSFLWLNGSSEVIESDRYQFSDGGANLTIVNVTRYDQGPFTCQVSNPVSEDVSAAVNLSISFGPDDVILTKSPSKDYYLKGSNVTLSCSADSSPAALFYWFVNGDNTNETRPEFTLNNLPPIEADISCQAFNPKTGRYEMSETSVFSVQERVSGVSVTPSTRPPTEEYTFFLTCDGPSTGVTREWMKDGAPLTMADNLEFSNHKRLLYFSPLYRTDSGEYSCNVSNDINSEEATYKLTVYYGPENAEITGPSEIHVGQNLTLTCSATESSPSATYTWTLNGKEIHNSSVFMKNSAELSDSGLYICRARNPISEKTASARRSVSVTDSDNPGCSGGCIAGIVVACLVVAAAVCGGGGYYIYKKQKNQKIIT